MKGINEILSKHIEFAEQTIKTQEDMSPMVIVCRGDTITPVLISGSREEIRSTIDLFGGDVDWIVVMMTAWVKIGGITEEYMRNYEPDQIASDPHREEAIVVQASLKDGTKGMIVERIIREEEEIRFEEVCGKDSGVSSDGYLSR